MARGDQRRNQNPPPKEFIDHQFLQFPRCLNSNTHTRYKGKPSLLLHKEIDIAPSFDWGLVTHTRLDDLIQCFLTYTHLDAGGVLFLYIVVRIGCFGYKS